MNEPANRITFDAQRAKPRHRRSERGARRTPREIEKDQLHG
jgi:hypothetical protein